jgi:hypothetical protein
MRAIILGLLLAGAALSQTVSSYVEYGLSHGSVTKGATLSSTACTNVRFGTSAATYSHRTMHVDTTTTPGWQLAGLAPATQYFWRIYNTACTGDEADDTALDTEQTFTTSADVAHPVYATLPTDNGISPSGYTSLSFTATLDVHLTDCNNVSTGLQAQINIASDASHSGNNNYKIVVPSASAYTCLGAYTLPVKLLDPNGAGFIVIVTDSTLLPPAGIRVGLADSLFMPRIRSNNSSSAGFTAAAGAKGYWIRGMDVRANDQTAAHDKLMNLAPGTNMVIDQCLIIGALAPGSTTRAVHMGAGNTLINSYAYASKVNSNASIGVGISSGNNGKIENNYIAGSGIGIYFDETVGSQVQSDWIVRRNFVDMPELWKAGAATSDGNRYTFRQMIEVKRGQRILFEGNIFNRAWVDELILGEVILLMAARNPDPGPTNCAVCDITIRHNWFGRQKVSGGVAIGSYSGDQPGVKIQIIKRVSIYGNLWSDLDPTYACASPCANPGGGRGYLLRVDAIEDLLFFNNTVHKLTNVNGDSIASLFNPIDCCGEGLYHFNNLLWADNVGGWGPMRYGSNSTALIAPDGVTNMFPLTPKQKLDLWAVRAPSASYFFTTNAIIAGTSITTATISAANYFPGINYFPGDGASGEAAVGWDGTNTSTEVRSHGLTISSIYNSKAYDGRGLGVPLATLYEKTGGTYNESVQAVGTTTATIGFGAPGNAASAVQVCASADSFVTQVCVAATVNSAVPTYQTASLTGLAAASNHTFRIYASGLVYSGTFRTR